MNPDGEQKAKTAGRGGIILKMMQMKQEAEAKARAEAEARSSLVQIAPPKTPKTTSAPTVTAGRGRASLLTMLKSMKTEEATPPMMGSKETKPSVAQGRASLLSLVKSVSSIEKPLEQPSTSAPPHQASTLTSKLSELSIEETASTKSVFPPPQQISDPSRAGRPVQLKANYINLSIDPGKGLFNYEVKYHPNIDSIPLRRNLLNQHVAEIGRTKVFDGTTLYLPQKLSETTTVFESVHPGDGTPVRLTLIYKKLQTMSENVPFFNVLLGRVMRSLSLVRIGQHSFNPKCIHSVPQHRLEVWPGYVTAINEFKGGLKLCMDAKHRVMRTETVRDIMITLQARSQDMKAAVTKELIGLSVFTRYNNKTYRVDDIAWDKNPLYVFDKGDNKISLVDYYKSHWNLQIQDTRQPLLINFTKIKTSTGATQEREILLVPELCYIASLTDSIRSDYRIMKDLDAITKIAPNSRRDVLQQFVKEVQKNDVSREILSEWGLRLETDLTEFTGRTFEHECIYFGNNKTFTQQPGKPAEWSRAATTNLMLRSPSLNRWFIVHSPRDARCSRDFSEMLRKISTVMGMHVTEPQVVRLNDDRTESYVQALRNNIQKNVNLMVIIFPSNRTDRYAAVKKVCCVQMPIASQVIISRTICNADKLKSVTEKIALQISCKMGGALWALTIPLENCMICGIDVYHGGTSQPRGSVAGFVASLDKPLTKWHSKICLQGRNQEIVDLLQICFNSALNAYREHNQRYPDRIIVYRDGVGDGQMEMIAKYEVKQILATFRNIEPSYNPKLTVIVVQKRINTRVFAKCGSGLANPAAGTVVDSVITKFNLYDFFLVSQNIRQGTVSPTHYTIVYDTTNMKAENLQKLTYKLCHLYYNWPGTIKVPAPCQYAHKLVSLVGQTIQQEPHSALIDTLYYL